MSPKSAFKTSENKLQFFEYINKIASQKYFPKICGNVKIQITVIVHNQNDFHLTDQILSF